jgi:hypothetical protein
MSVRMSAQNARQALVIGWFACFLISLAILLSLYFGEWIYPDNFRSALTQLSSLYAPYLGAILAFYFSSRTQPSRPGAAAGAPFVLAVLGSVIWNLTILIVLAKVFFLLGTIEGAIRDLLFFGSTLSWLVAPAMGFYFGNSSKAKSKEEQHEN